MEENKALVVREEGFLKNLKNLFCKIRMFLKGNKQEEWEKELEENAAVESQANYIADIFTKRQNIEINVEADTEIRMLKKKLENAEIQAVDLEDEKIEELQKLYDREIWEKRLKLNDLKQQKNKLGIAF